MMPKYVQWYAVLDAIGFFTDLFMPKIEGVNTFDISELVCGMNTNVWPSPSRS